MTLRMSAYAAGVVGLILLMTGWIADSQRPSTTVTASVEVGSSVVVLEPEVVAVEQIVRITASGTGALEVHSARPVDAQAWLVGRPTTFVTGIPQWDQVGTRIAMPTGSTPEPSASPAVTDEAATPEASPSPEVSPSPEAADAAGDETTEALGASSDHWRTTWRGQGRVSVLAAAVPPGETLVIASANGTALTTVELSLVREVNDGWITPLQWWGALLASIGVIAVVLALVDVRPLQRKSEEWINTRGKDGETASPAPGTRRARRLAGSSIPVASLDGASDAATGDGSADTATDTQTPEVTE